MAESDEPMQSATTIYDLNDHVLRKVFEHLSLHNLVAVADVNANFRQNARAVVSTRYKDKRLNVSILKREGIESYCPTETSYISKFWRDHKFFANEWSEFGRKDEIGP